MALHKTLLKKRLKYWHPLPPKTSYCDKNIGSRELIFVTIHIKKCMKNLEFFQPNLRWSSGEIFLNSYVWHGMTHKISCLLSQRQHNMSLLMDIQQALAITGPSKETVLKQSSRLLQVILLTKSTYNINNIKKAQNKKLCKIKQFQCKSLYQNKIAIG